MKDAISRNEFRHTHNTRSYDLTLPLTKTKLEEQLLQYKVFKSWNNLPISFKTNVPSTMNTFCKLFKSHKIDKYPTECTIQQCYICNRI